MPSLLLIADDVNEAARACKSVKRAWEQEVAPLCNFVYSSCSITKSAVLHIAFTVGGFAPLKISFEAKDKPCRTIDAFGGMTLMEAAVQAGIEEIEAACGGGCACGTCHVYVDEAWRGLTGLASSFEAELVQSLDNARPNSRLACQINLASELDGMKVVLPDKEPV